ncbi:MAG: hypothetical protein ACFB0D_15905 [Phormidesmis sp.]
MKNQVKIAVVVCLVAPLILREASGALEPYPAVLQPSGAHKVSTNNALLEFPETQLFALRKAGAKKAAEEGTKIDTSAFMGNIPSHYWEQIAIAHYGLGEGKSQSASLGRWTLTANTIKSASPQEREEALHWIHSRLSAQGIDNVDTLRIRYLKTFWDIETNSEVKREIKREIDVDIKQ